MTLRSHIAELFGRRAFEAALASTTLDVNKIRALLAIATHPKARRCRVARSTGSQDRLCVLGRGLSLAGRLHLVFGAGRPPSSRGLVSLRPREKAEPIAKNTSKMELWKNEQGVSKRPKKRLQEAKPAAEERKSDQTAEKFLPSTAGAPPYRNRSNTFGAASQVQVIDPKTGGVTRGVAPSRYNPITDR